MKFYLLSLLLLLPLKQNQSFKVVTVLDGDTIDILKPGNKTQRIRFNGIDAPEKAQAFGMKSKQSLLDLVGGKEVRIVEKEIDRYGRTIADVYLPGDSISVNARMVRAGLAWHYVRYSSSGQLSKFESEARAKRLGLWADPLPEAPWDYRQRMRQ